MQLLELPLELIAAILEVAIKEMYIRESIQLRHVNRLFARETTEALFRSGMMKSWRADELPGYSSSYKIIDRYLCFRAEGPPGSCQLLKTINETSNTLADYGRDRNEATLQLCSAVLSTWHDDGIIELLHPGHTLLHPPPPFVTDARVNILSLSLLIRDDFLTDQLMTQELFDYTPPEPSSVCYYFGDPQVNALKSGRIDIFQRLWENSLQQSSKLRWVAKPRQRGPFNIVEAAAAGGYVEILSLILQKTGQAQHDVFDAIHTASSTGRLDILDSLSSFIDLKKPVLVRQSLRDRRETWLVAGAEYNQPDIVKYFMNVGVDAYSNYGDKYFAAVEAATWAGNDNLLKILLTQHADLRTKTLDDKEPHRYWPVEVALKRGLKSTFKILVEHNVDIDGGCTAPVLLAAIQDDIDAVKLLFEKGATLQTDPNNTLYTFLARASGYNISTAQQLKYLAMFLDHGLDLQLEAPSEDRMQVGNSPAQLMIEEGRWEIVKFLEDHGERPVVYGDGVWSWKDRSNTVTHSD